MNQYDPLYKWLSRCKQTSARMSFSELEQILGFPLPDTATLRPQWWANEQSSKTRHVQCKAWLDAGFNAHPNLSDEIVVFTKQPMST
jgi:hypothetical protein